MGTTPKNAKMIARIAGILLGILILIGSAATGHLLPYNLDTINTFLNIVGLAGLGLVVVFAIGGYIEQIGVKTLNKGDKWIDKGRYRAVAILALLMLLYILTYGSFTFYRHYSFNSTGYDLAIQDQVVWNTAQGRPFESSIEVRNYLGDHVQPYLAILSIVYILISSPYVLLAFQTFALSLCAWPLYFLGKRKFDSPMVGLSFAFCALAYPPLGYINRVDFHIEVIVVPLMLAAFERIDAKKFKTASVLMGLVLFAKEEMGLTVAALGLVSALCYKRWRFGLTWTAVGTVYALVALFVIIPVFRGEPSDTLGFYQWLGDTPIEMLKTLALNPVFVAKRMIEPRRISTLLQLLAPLAFLPLFSLTSLAPIVPALIYNFLSLSEYQSTIYCHYMAIIIPFIFVAGVMGLYRLTTGSLWKWLLGWMLPEKGHSRYGTGLGLTLMVLAVMASWLYQNPFIDDGKAHTTATFVQPNEASVRQGLKHVPDDAYVVTLNNYAPHLSQRRKLYIFMNDTIFNTEAESIFFNLRDLRAWSTCELFRQYLEFAYDSGFGITYF
jgi:uncharacterized membrane protein